MPTTTLAEKGTGTRHPGLLADSRWQLVERIIASPHLSKSGRLCSFLQFVCEETLLGRGDQLNEQKIGVQVFERRVDYDSAEDNIVRSHASRLRQRLEAYFLVEGQNEPLRLTLPRGPSRHGRETLKLIQHAQRNGMERMIPGYHDRGVDTFQGLVELQTRRNAAKDKLKRRIAEILGDDTPVGWGNVHLQGIRLLIPTCPNVQAVEEVRQWAVYDEILGESYSRQWAKVLNRRNKGYEYVAHDIGKLLQGRIVRLGVEKKFLKAMNEHQSHSDPEGVKHARKYRQWAGLGTFLSILKHTLAKYGITIVEVSSKHTTVRCHQCEAEIKAAVSLNVRCPNCDVEFDQDKNAARNIGMAAFHSEKHLQIAAAASVK